MSITRKLASMASSLWHGISRVIEPRILFPFVTLLLLAGVWGATLNLARVEMANAKESSRALTAEMMETYEAQVVRALREIRQDLQLVQYAYEQRGRGQSPT